MKKIFTLMMIVCCAVATMAENVVVDTVRITIPESVFPKAGETFPTQTQLEQAITSTTGTTLNRPNWYNKQSSYMSGKAAIGGTTYQIIFQVKLQSGYEWASKYVIIVNDSVVNTWWNNSYGGPQVNYTYKIPTTGLEKISPKFTLPKNKIVTPDSVIPTLSKTDFTCNSEHVIISSASWSGGSSPVGYEKSYTINIFLSVDDAERYYIDEKDTITLNDSIKLVFVGSYATGSYKTPAYVAPVTPTITIDTVRITIPTAAFPAKGETFSTQSTLESLITSTPSEGVTINRPNWYTAGYYYVAGRTAMAGADYSLTFQVLLGTGYEWASKYVIIVNDSVVNTWWNTSYGGPQVTYNYNISPAGMEKISSINFTLPDNKMPTPDSIKPSMSKTDFTCSNSHIIVSSSATWNGSSPVAYETAYDIEFQFTLDDFNNYYIDPEGTFTLNDTIALAYKTFFFEGSYTTPAHVAPTVTIDTVRITIAESAFPKKNESFAYPSTLTSLVTTSTPGVTINEPTWYDAEYNSQTKKTIVAGVEYRLTFQTKLNTGYVWASQYAIIVNDSVVTTKWNSSKGAPQVDYLYGISQIDVKVASVANGTIAVSNTEPNVGDEITITTTPKAGYQLKDGSIVVYKTGEPETTVEVIGNKFVAPNYAVTVTATFEEKTPTAIEQVELNSLEVRDGRIYCDGDFRIYDLVGHDVTRLNGNLRGVYVVKCADKATKVVVR